MRRGAERWTQKVLVGRTGRRVSVARALNQQRIRTRLQAGLVRGNAKRRILYAISDKWKWNVYR